MKKIIYALNIISLTLCIQGCNKLKNKIENKMHVPDYSYKNEKIDEFYYANETAGSSNIIPLVKPFDIIKEGSPQVWELATFDMPNELGNVISPITFINVSTIYIYGHKPFEKDEVGSNFDSPEKWFIINTQEKKLTFFDKESDFKIELKKLNLPEEFLNPDEVYEQYKKDPNLPWFPEEIKKQLEAVKARKQ